MKQYSLKDVRITDDMFLAALVRFAGGHIYKVQTDLQGKPTFSVLCAEEDYKLICTEYTEPDGHLVNIRRFCESISELQALVEKSQANGGIYTERI